MNVLSRGRCRGVRSGSPAMAGPARPRRARRPARDRRRRGSGGARGRAAMGIDVLLGRARGSDDRQRASEGNRSPGAGQPGRTSAGGGSSPARNAAMRSSAASRTGSSPCPSFGHSSSRPFGSVGMAASSRSIRANGSDVPRQQQRRDRDPRPVGGPRPAVSARPGGWSGYERQTSAAYRRAAPSASGRRPPPTATPPGRRTSARRPRRPARPGPAPRMPRPRPRPCASGARARGPRTRGRAGPRPRAPWTPPCPTRRDRDRCAAWVTTVPRRVACWYPRPGRPVVPTTHGPRASPPSTLGSMAIAAARRPRPCRAVTATPAG